MILLESGPEQLRRPRWRSLYFMVHLLSPLMPLSPLPLPLPPPAGRHADRKSSALLEIGIFASHIIWLVRTRHIRKAAAAQGKTFDDIAREHEEQGRPFKFAERKWRPKSRKAPADEEMARVGVDSSGGSSEKHTSDGPANGDAVEGEPPATPRGAF